jgi:hypothetical protein
MNIFKYKQTHIKSIMPGQNKKFKNC